MPGLEKNIQALFKWDGQDFKLVPIQKNIEDNRYETYLIVNESQRSLTLRLGEGIKNIEKLNITRKFHSIPKTGLLVDGVTLGLEYHKIEHEGPINLWQHLKVSTSSRVPIITENGLAIQKATARIVKTKENAPRKTSRPVVGGTSPLSGKDAEAFNLGLKILNHIENGRTVIVNPDKTIQAFKKFE